MADILWQRPVPLTFHMRPRLGHVAGWGRARLGSSAWTQPASFQLLPAPPSTWEPGPTVSCGALRLPSWTDPPRQHPPGDRGLAWAPLIYSEVSQWVSTLATWENFPGGAPAVGLASWEEPAYSVEEET